MTRSIPLAAAARVPRTETGRTSRVRVSGEAPSVFVEHVAPAHELFVDRGGEAVVEERRQVDRDVRVAERLMRRRRGDDRLRAALCERVLGPRFERLGADRERHRDIGNRAERDGEAAEPTFGEELLGDGRGRARRSGGTTARRRAATPTRR